MFIFINFSPTSVKFSSYYVVTAYLSIIILLKYDLIYQY